MSEQIEGRNAVLEAFRSGKCVDKLFILDGCQDGPVRTIAREARKKDTIINYVAKERLDQLSETGAHQGVIAQVAAYEYASVEDILAKAREKGEDPFIFILDNIEDPHNLGAIIRTANLAGAHGVIIPKRRAVGLTATVAKTSAGALNYTPVAKVTNLVKTMEELKEKGTQMKPEIDDILVKLYPVYKDLPEADFINDQDDVYTKDDFWDDLSNQEKYNVNSLYLKMIGDPKHDYIMCWEPGRFDENEAVTDYTDFYDVDYKWWEFQKNANWSNIEDQKKMMLSGSKTYTPEKVAESINSFNDEYSEYKISMTGDWYRLIERDTFIYAEMISLKWYLFYKAEFFLDSLQDEHIPYELKDADFETLLNTRDPEEKYNAAGREK